MQFWHGFVGLFFLLLLVFLLAQGDFLSQVVFSNGCPSSCQRIEFATSSLTNLRRSSMSSEVLEIVLKSMCGRTMKQGIYSAGMLNHRMVCCCPVEK